jgi:trimethylamine--corrinoid protein Co-methyltransferase
MLQHSVKPIVFISADRADCEAIVAMAAAAAGGIKKLRLHPTLCGYSQVVTPLVHPQESLEKLLYMAEQSLPTIHMPSPMMGGTAPITMAAGLTMSLAEILSALVVHQLKNPGAPFVFGAGLHHMDMKAAQICYASPEFQLTKAAVAELGRWYGIPTWGYAGCSDAKVMDEQAAAEAMLSVVMAKLTGANLIHDVGYMESGLTGSYEMIVLTDELIGLADHLMKGIQVSEETLMLDELHQVGPGGHFLNTPNTHQRYKEFWYPGLLSREIRESWVENGELTLGDRLKSRVKEIINEHKPDPLDPGVKEQIADILERAKKEIK